MEAAAIVGPLRAGEQASPDLIRDTWQRHLLLALTCIYIALMVRAQHHKLESFAMGFDLAVYEQVIWNTAQGRPFASSVLGDTPVHLGRDLILVELFLAAPYALIPSTYTLLVLQTLAVATGAFVVYRLGRKHLGTTAGLVLGIAYLFYLPLQFLNLYEFQPRAFAVTPTLLAILFLDERRLLPYVLSLLAMLSTRSDVALVVVMLGFLAMLHRHPRPFAYWAVGLGLAWFGLAVFVVVPHFNAEGQFPYFNWFKSEDLDRDPAFAAPGTLSETLLTAKSGRFLAAVYGPLALLPLLRPDVLLLSLPVVAMGALSKAPTFLDIRYQYAALLYPTAFAGAIYAIRWLTTRVSSAKGLRLALLVAICASTALSYGLRLSPVVQWNSTSPPAGRLRAVRRLIATIPPSASVATNSCLSPFLARRERLYLYPPGSFARGFYATDMSRVDYVLVDRLCSLENPAAGPLPDVHFVAVAERAGITLYRREP